MTNSYAIFTIGSPPPTKYNLKSTFEVGKPGTAGSTTKAGIYSFGLGRDHFTKVYMPQKLQNSLNVPGPGQYTI